MTSSKILKKKDLKYIAYEGIRLRHDETEGKRLLNTRHVNASPNIMTFSPIFLAYRQGISVSFPTGIAIIKGTKISCEIGKYMRTTHLNKLHRYNFQGASTHGPSPSHLPSSCNAPPLRTLSLRNSAHFTPWVSNPPIHAKPLRSKPTTIRYLTPIQQAIDPRDHLSRSFPIWRSRSTQLQRCRFHRRLTFVAGPL